MIAKARVHADQVLSAARARTDGHLRGGRGSGEAPAAVARERRLEDRVVREERADADDVLKLERAEHVALLALEREDTDKDLVRERGRSDDALASRDELLGIVSHDLRTMLHQVMGYADLIALELSGRPELGHLVDDASRIQRSGRRMNRLIGDLTDMAGIQAVALTVVPCECAPEGVVTEAVDAFQPQAVARGLTVIATLVAPVPDAVFDPPRILQVLTNLLSNAIKFTPSGGSVTLRLERAGPDLRFTVTDTGIGIPGDKLDAVFDRYLQVTSNDRRGVGLGLYISKCIVQGHGGRIWAESTPGEGSVFSFTIPVAGPGAAGTDTPSQR